MGAVAAVQPLPGGRLLVNDPVKRRVVLLDSSLKQVAVVADTTAATRNAYGTRNGGLIPFRGDSALFVDPASLSMLVIDPAGKIARIMAAPRANDVIFLLGGPMGNPGFDAKGRLVYRSMGFGDRRAAAPRAGPAVHAAGVPDSVPIVRYDLAARKLDTAAFVKVYAPKLNIVQTEGGGMRMSTVINPIPEVDDWAVLPDGTIAIVRKDYHVDFVDADGKRTSAPKIPFDWQRLTDSAKTAVIDSAKAAFERMRAGGPGAGPRRGSDGHRAGRSRWSAPRCPSAGCGTMIMIRERGPEGAAPPSRGAAPSGAAAGPPPMSVRLAERAARLSARVLERLRARRRGREAVGAHHVAQAGVGARVRRDRPDWEARRSRRASGGHDDRRIRRRWHRLPRRARRVGRSRRARAGEVAVARRRFGADPSTSLGMTASVIPSERSESRDLHS